MNDLHLPNRLPLIYYVRRRCISLLDDGAGRDPKGVHDFGSAAQYLFRPCELTDENFDQMAATASPRTAEPEVLVVGSEDTNEGPVKSIPIPALSKCVSFD